MTEAVNFIDKKCAHLTSLSDTLTQDAARIKAHIKLVLEVSLTLVLVNMCVIFNVVVCVKFVVYDALLTNFSSDGHSYFKSS